LVFVSEPPEYSNLHQMLTRPTQYKFNKTSETSCTMNDGREKRGRNLDKIFTAKTNSIVKCSITIHL
jgi:hypothetical protein